MNREMADPDPFTPYDCMYHLHRSTRDARVSQLDSIRRAGVLHSTVRGRYQHRRERPPQQGLLVFNFSQSSKPNPCPVGP